MGGKIRDVRFFTQEKVPKKRTENKKYKVQE